MTTCIALLHFYYSEATACSKSQVLTLDMNYSPFHFRCQVIPQFFNKHGKKSN